MISAYLSGIKTVLSGAGRSGTYISIAGILLLSSERSNPFGLVLAGKYAVSKPVSTPPTASAFF